MNFYLLSSNVLTWSLQVCGLLAVAAAVPFITGLKAPKARLVYWQLVLVACLLLPALRTWKRPATGGIVAVTATYEVVARPSARPPFSYPSSELILMFLAVGIAIRVLWLVIGLIRLARHRANSEPLEPGSSWGVEADLRVSRHVASPVTFGFRRPVILLPTTFPALHEDMREAILCHEVLHIRRGDWLFTMAEEAIRAALWFHPGIWWLLGEIQLTREQAVDAEVIAMTNSRDRYVDALLSMAGAPMQPDLALAPLFLRRRQLKQRVVSILKEVRMSRTKTFSALAAGILALGASSWLITGALPLQAAPPDAPGVTVDTNGAEILHRTGVQYPDSAAEKNIGGRVALLVKLDDKGNVADASVISGPDELRAAALKSVLSWHFSKEAASGTRQISVLFEPGKAPQSKAMQVTASSPFPTAAVKQVLLSGIDAPDNVRGELLSQLNANGISVGQSYDFMDLMRRANTAAKGVDEHLIGRIGSESTPGQMGLRFEYPGSPNIPPPPPPPLSVPGAMLVGADVAAAKLISQATPIYPPLAKAARVQGAVKFQAAIAKDGSVANLQLISGPPLLVKAATDAATQWVYAPTMLNGQPVPILTTITINFTLSE